ncbi:PaaI family thioesterase [Cellulosilyticum sp. WCF-2]|uniref:PaaI family thioesterase n=1 Tax=Cellulosilyticum sp. WCF-2 TaxID=2497860 RepID=UPI000F8F6B65|nr:PaaI family thioesterase [Cellulosilyticum sp. WCF-2]QEH69143.1 PaaI family thioesterase [Cellulosilyticum sp. WCF-2]
MKMCEEEVRAFFEEDLFAKHCGIRIDHIEENQAICSMELTAKHRNAGGQVQGGAIFTLGDFAFAVAANSGEKKAVSLDNQIAFMRKVQGDKLIATASVISSTYKICFYQVDIEDEWGTKVARMSVTGYYV